MDVEADGPIPPKYSMVCFGAVVVEPTELKVAPIGRPVPSTVVAIATPVAKLPITSRNWR